MPNEPTDRQKAQAVQDSQNKGPHQKIPIKKRPKDQPAQTETVNTNFDGMKPRYKELGAIPKAGIIKTIKWNHAVHKERKKLRKDLKENGVKSRQEFEIIATELGYVYKDGGFLLFFWRWWGRIAGGLKALGLVKALMLLGGGALLTTFLASYLSEYAGSFTIQLNPDMLKCKFELCDTPDFAKPTSRLFSLEVKEANAITIAGEDISPTVDTEADGSHNGRFYVAYTFYIRNNGEVPGTYEYTLTMENSLFKTDKACWIMLFEDGHQMIYAAKSADGDEERLIGFEEPPFYDSCYDPEYQYYQTTLPGNTYGNTSDGVDDLYYLDKDMGTRHVWGLRTTPAIDDNIIVKGIVEDVQPQEVHKYTAVIWLEGYDPECTNDLYGGFAKYQMTFSVPDEQELDLFSDVFRKEYDEYYKKEAEKQKEKDADKQSEENN